MKNKNKGISLIVLIITIIVMIILAGAVILSLTRSGIIDNTDEAKLKSNLTAYRDQLAVSISDSIFADIEFDAKNLTETSSGSIQAYIPSISEKDAAKYWIQRGEIVYSDYEVENNLFTDKTTGITENEKKFARELGIQRYAETFEKNHSYSSTGLYANPTPQNPAVLLKALKRGMLAVSGITSIDAFETNFLQFEAVVAQGEEENDDGTENDDYEEMNAVFFTDLNFTTEIVSQHIYVFEDETIEVNGIERNIKKGWNYMRANVADDNNFHILELTNSGVKAPNFDGTLVFEDKGEEEDDDWNCKNLEYLGYYISTKPY